MLSRKGSDAPSGRFNAGEKILVLGAPLLSVGDPRRHGPSSISPNFRQTRRVMQQAISCTLISALLGVTVAFSTSTSHGRQRGAYQRCARLVDEAWAKEHHSYWYADVKAGRRPAEIRRRCAAENALAVLQAIRRADETQPQKLFRRSRRPRRCRKPGRRENRQARPESKPGRRAPGNEVSAHARKYYRTARSEQSHVAHS